MINSYTIKQKSFTGKQTVEDTTKTEPNKSERAEQTNIFSGCGAFCVVHDSSRGKSFISLSD